MVWVSLLSDWWGWIIIWKFNETLHIPVCVNHQNFLTLNRFITENDAQLHTLLRVKQTFICVMMSRPYLIHCLPHIITLRMWASLITILTMIDKTGKFNSLGCIYLNNVDINIANASQIADHLGPRGAAVPLGQEEVPPHPDHRVLQGLHQDQEHRAIRQRHIHLHGWVLSWPDHLVVITGESIVCTVLGDEIPHSENFNFSWDQFNMQGSWKNIYLD